MERKPEVRSTSGTRPAVAYDQPGTPAHTSQTLIHRSGVEFDPLEAATQLFLELLGCGEVRNGCLLNFNSFGLVDGCRKSRPVPQMADQQRCAGAIGSLAIPGVSSYAVSPRKGKRIEACSGWVKRVVLLRKSRAQFLLNSCSPGLRLARPK
jgi:hypothetical protein